MESRNRQRYLGTLTTPLRRSIRVTDHLKAIYADTCNRQTREPELRHFYQPGFDSTPPQFRNIADMVHYVFAVA